MSAFSTPAVSEAGKAIALAVVVSVMVAYVPVAGFFLVLLLPLPLAYLTLRRGVRVGAAASLCTGVLAALLAGPSRGFLSLLLAGLVGVIVGLGLRRNWSFTPLLFAATAAVAFSLVASTLVLWTITGTGWQEVRVSFDRSLETAVELYRTAGMAEETVARLTDQVKEAFRLIPYLAPSIVGVSSLLFASASLGLAAVLFPRVGEEGARRLSFSRFRLHWSVAYGFIAGLGLLVLARGSSPAGEALRFVGLNLYMFFWAVFFLQGLAVTHWLVVSRRMGAGTRTLVYGLALFSQLLLQLLTWAGLFDTWIDYRKRFAPRPGGPPGTAPAGGGDERKKEE